ncbi:hypothetical protein AGDE_11851 [Angomonas deanei]|nr:hypothetical protein AGDE_11851 [Angomonas deanei]|eukprot:EPY25356.1 hypothetical protein AGDE_11851 [Angomonas deanei]
MIPSSVFSPLNVGREETTTHDVDCDRVEGEEDTEALLDVMQRVLVEDSANNAVDIHVREMEQLTPPPELLADDDVAAEKSKPVEEPKKKGKGSRKRKAEPIPEPPKALSPLERVVALQKWRAEAAECSRQSQSSQQIQSDSHVITRVRLHQPYKTDIAVVQGFGGRKGVDDVLATLNRMLKREGEEEGGAKVGQLVPLRQMGLTFDNKGHFISVDGAQQYFSPFVLRPLLSVYASCLPRREPLLGCRTDEKAFLGFQKEEEGTTTAPDAPLSLSDAALYARLKAMYVPSMPRHSTLITVLVEHDTDLQPTDLISMAEITSFRKDNDEKTTSSSSDALGGKKATTKSKKKRYHIYCLISDGKRVLKKKKKCNKSDNHRFFSIPVIKGKQITNF